MSGKCLASPSSRSVKSSFYGFISGISFAAAAAEHRAGPRPQSSECPVELLNFYIFTDEYTVYSNTVFGVGVSILLLKLTYGASLSHFKNFI